ncbi:winged helix-turn-helix transcriptional regulator [Spirillospora sp. CA-294931]|uniref:winged helix-turn-helix transcriptional regulator n=1 Tax=Spirillospora sp. CA-294931 TaxID=3240042 RepID=UPI003D89CA5F
MRTYGQFCLAARALDVIGDRWTLLIVRELLLGPRRFGELRQGLPGIATNLLTGRLRDAQEHGIVEREGATYRLTPDGEALRPVMGELVRWGLRFAHEAEDDDVFHSRWLVLALRALLSAPTAAGRSSVLIDTGDEPILVTSAAGRLEVGLGRTSMADAVLTGPPDAVLGYLAGTLPAADAQRKGLRVTGDKDAVLALRG